MLVCMRICLWYTRYDSTCIRLVKMKTLLTSSGFTREDYRHIGTASANSVELDLDVHLGSTLIM